MRESCGWELPVRDVKELHVWEDRCVRTVVGSCLSGGSMHSCCGWELPAVSAVVLE